MWPDYIIIIIIIICGRTILLLLLLLLYVAGLYYWDRKSCDTSFEIARKLCARFYPFEFILIAKT